MNKFVRLQPAKAGDNTWSVPRSAILTAHLAGIAASRLVRSEIRCMPPAPMRSQGPAEIMAILRKFADRP